MNYVVKRKMARKSALYLDYIMKSTLQLLYLCYDNESADITLLQKVSSYTPSGWPR